MKFSTPYTIIIYLKKNEKKERKKKINISGKIMLRKAIPP
jgi:hypothetical protein